MHNLGVVKWGRDVLTNDSAKIYTQNRGKMQSCPCGIPEKKHRVVFPRQVNSESVVFVIVNTCAAAAVGGHFPIGSEEGGGGISVL